MMKAHRSDLEDLRNFVLVEELEVSGADSQLGRRHSSESIERRILSDDENVYLAQSEWKTNGKFVIMDRHQAETEENPVCGSKPQAMYMKTVIQLNLFIYLEHFIDLYTTCTLFLVTFYIRFGALFFLQCEKKRKGFITKGPKSKSLSTGKILIAVKLDAVWHGIDTINVEVSDRT